MRYWTALSKIAYAPKLAMRRRSWPWYVKIRSDGKHVFKENGMQPDDDFYVPSDEDIFALDWEVNQDGYL